MAEYGDYDIPFDGMSEDEFLFRSMNEEDPMYMGPVGGTTYVRDEEGNLYVQDEEGNLYIEDEAGNLHPLQ